MILCRNDTSALNFENAYQLKKLSLQEAVRLLRYCLSLYKMHGVAANVQLLKPYKGMYVHRYMCMNVRYLDVGALYQMYVSESCV